jgi:hypothetical protein
MTATQGIEDSQRCLFCGSVIDMNDLDMTGLSTEELEIIAQHAKDGTLKNMLIVAQIAWQRLDPEKATSEFQVREAVSKLREVSNQLTKTFFQGIREFIDKLSIENNGDRIQLMKEYEEK